MNSTSNGNAQATIKATEALSHQATEAIFKMLYDLHA
jgi:hypothetical protein